MGLNCEVLAVRELEGVVGRDELLVGGVRGVRAAAADVAANVIGSQLVGLIMKLGRST